jgi:hypothetical protein
MIIATLYIKKSISLNDILRILQTLPDNFKPVYFSPGEKLIKKNRIINGDDFSNFLLKSKFGFFLHSVSGVKFDLSLGSMEFTKVTLWQPHDEAYELVHAYIKQLLSVKPIFGFACTWDEYIHRNRHFKKIGVNNIECWVGRDTQKYIPGLYWITVLPDELLKKHNASLQEFYHLKNESRSYFLHDTHVVSFFGNPIDWGEHSHDLDEVCSKSNGFFSIRTIDEAASHIENYEEHSNLIDKWK